MNKLKETESTSVKTPRFGLRSIFILLAMIGLGLGIWINTHEVWGLLYFNYLLLIFGFCWQTSRTYLFLSLVLVAVHTLIITGNVIYTSQVVSEYSIPRTMFAMLFFYLDYPLHQLLNWIGLNRATRNFGIWQLSCLWATQPGLASA